MSTFYYNFASIILPIHIISAVIWVGAMVGYVVSTYPSIKQIPNKKLMVRTSIRTLRRLSQLIIVVSIILGITGVMIAIGASYGDKDPLLAAIINTKEALWIFMFLNTIVIFYKVLQSKQKCMASDAAGAKDNVRLISNYLIMVNIFLGLTATYFGMMLRN
ncbi:MAG: hypothetical protein K0U47_11315 [Epsilonproteobacteria bacterium]|nr:hypothetical protein [Campylobacterota bacterium]